MKIIQHPTAEQEENLSAKCSKKKSKHFNQKNADLVSTRLVGPNNSFPYPTQHEGWTVVLGHNIAYIIDGDTTTT
eukprot:10251372-Ditylum_brightwellii.AAC.1